MDTFLIEIAHDFVTDTYVACYSNGANVQLGATSYMDAVLEADMLTAEDYDCA